VSLEVSVVTPERELWSGPASMVIARGVDGEVGVLAGHVPMLVSLAVGPLRIQREGAPEEVIVVDGGFLHVTSEGEATRVDVLAERATPAGEVDVAGLEASILELERAAAGGDEAAAAELARVRATLAAATGHAIPSA
jgi:F-type H+-transporting ATPase subunit epsilon